MDQSGLKFEPAAETKDQSFITTGMVQLVQPQPASPTAAASDEATGSVQQPSGEIFQTFDSVEEARSQLLSEVPVSVKRLAARFSNNGQPADFDCIYAISLTLTIVIPSLALISYASSGEPGWPLFSLLAAGGSGMAMWQSARLEQAKTAMENMHLGPKYLGAMCEALEWPDRRIRSIAGLLLTQMLPRLSERDCEALTKEQRNCLYRSLAPKAARRNPGLTIAILRSLRVLGAEGALPNVAHLAQAFAFTGSGHRIQDQARATLPGLEQRVADQRAAEEARMAAEAAVAARNLETHSTVESNERTEIAETVDAQIKEFEEELRKINEPGMRFGFLIAAWGIIVPYGAIQAFEQFTHFNWPLGLLCAALAAGTTQLYRLTMTDKHRLLAKRLGQMDDLRFIGRLCELLEWPDPDIRAVAVGALTRLLRRVKASDGILCTPSQLAALYRNLTPSEAGRQAELMISILKALEQIGDLAAVPYVVQLANAKPASDRERSVCDAASECLPYLNQRAKFNESSHILLRASSAESTGADSLMRAASPSAATDPEQLLRAQSGGD